MKTYIIIKTQFEAVHCWPDCPHKDVSFLRNYHRHIFHIEVKKQVEHGNREIEFIRFKRKIDKHIQTLKITLGGIDSENYIGSLSCEQMAESILKVFNAYSVKVFEDNENGAEVTR